MINLDFLIPNGARKRWRKETRILRWSHKILRVESVSPIWAVKAKHTWVKNVLKIKSQHLCALLLETVPTLPWCCQQMSEKQVTSNTGKKTYFKEVFLLKSFCRITKRIIWSFILQKQFNITFVFAQIQVLFKNFSGIDKKTRTSSCSF
jgi:hypothetical protein